MATINNISLVGTKLKIEYADGEEEYMNDVLKVKNEAYLIGLDKEGNKINVFYADVSAGTKATGVFTAAANPTDGDTVTIDTKVYTFQDTLTNVDGNVHIGASASASLDNLISAITLTSGVPGTDYATAMTIHPTVTAAAGAGDTMDVTAKLSGTDGNVASEETGAQISFAAATLTGGASNGKLDLAALAASLEAA